MEIKHIKQNLNILSVAEQYGYKPNRNHLIKCPFHADDKPSLQFYPATNTWHCFGCNKGTDVIDFIQFKENCSTHEALIKAKNFLQHFPTITTKPMNIEAPKQITNEQRTEILTKAFTYFARSLASTSSATHDKSPTQYLQKRNLDPKKITVGYDGHNFHKHKDVTVELKDLYVSVGLLYPDKLGRTNNFHSFFDGCVVFPTFNEKNEIVNLYGRCIADTERSRSDRNTLSVPRTHRYLPGKHQGIYPNYPKAETEKLIITECIIDAATLLQINEIKDNYSIIACYGTNNFTTEHQNVIKNLQELKEVILFYDGDKAGRESIEMHGKIINEAVTERSRSNRLKISYVETPDNEDINSLLLGHEVTILTELLSERKLLFSDAVLSLLRQDSVQVSKEENKQENQPEHIEIPMQDNKELFVSFPKTNYIENLNTDNPEALIYKNDWLTATVWGGIDFYNIKKLRTTLHLQSKSNEYLEYRDTIDLYSNSHTQKIVKEAGEKLETGTNTMLKTIAGLTKALEQYRQKEREKQRKREEEQKNKNREVFTPLQMQQGGIFLKDKELMQKTQNHINNIGLVGEEEKGMLLFFILLTRMFKEPLHALVQGKSGSGKTYLLKKIASLIPSAHIRMTTALTENTLYHSLKDFWKHMILLIEDLDGAFSALLPLREMMSNQSISKLSTEKDLKTGEFKQMMLFVEGPVCVAGATTKERIYEDNANRSFLIQVNESAEHQQKVLDYQRKDIAGLLDKTEQQQTQTILKTAQLHLESLEVVIPFGEELRIPDYVFKKLRTNAHYLNLIKVIAFWHQKQREIKQKPNGIRYIEANLNDVQWANKLSREVLLRKSDELNGTLRDFFESIKMYLKLNNMENFYAKPLREKLRMNPMQINRYLKELDQRGYLKQTGGNRKTGFEYTVTVWDDYEQLKSGMNKLDQVLEELRKGRKEVRTIEH